MRYLGSKRKYAGDIVPILSACIHDDTTFIDMCCGGCSIVAKVEATKKIAVDSNEYIIALWNHLKEMHLNGHVYDAIPYDISREQYESVKKSCMDKDGRFPAHYVGYVSTCCSFGGAYWGGYAAYNPRKHENHCHEAYNGLIKQVIDFKGLQDTQFVCKSFEEFEVPANSVIYADPPYFGTKKYKDDFNHEMFWEWARKMTNLGNRIFISEYDAPSDFRVVWQKVRKENLSQHIRTVTEKLFTI